MASHREVAHAWAHQTGKARNGKRLYYNGVSLISYSTTVARLVTLPAKVRPSGEPIAFFSVNTHSMSTRRHMGYARDATSHLIQFTVEDVAARHKTQHVANRNRMIREAKAMVDKSKRRRSQSRRDWDLREARDWLRMANDYASFFLPRHKRLTLVDLDKALANVDAAIRRAEKAEAKAQAEYRAKLAEKMRETRDAWLAGEDTYFHGRDEKGNAYARVVGDVLETSLGVKVPLGEAVKAFQFVKAVKTSGKPWHSNGHKVRVGDFYVNEIDERGNMRAGCHSFLWDEIERVAATIGADTLPASDAAVTAST